MITIQFNNAVEQKLNNWACKKVEKNTIVLKKERQFYRVT